jgi:hypothetical protein
MLKSMRKNARYFYVLFFVVIISFVFWGVGTNDKEKVRVFAEIGKERITSIEFHKTYENARDMYREIYKGKSIEEIEQKTNLKAMVLNLMIDEKVLFESARELGLVATDEELQQAIVKDPRFTRNGSFKKDIYVKALAFERLTPDAYEAMLRKSLTANRLRNMIMAGIDVTEADLSGIRTDEAKEGMIRQTLLYGKRNAALKSYIEGAKARLKVRIDMDAIS